MSAIRLLKSVTCFCSSPHIGWANVLRSSFVGVGVVVGMRCYGV